MVVLAGSPAAADTTYQPVGGWNGYKIYLSVACHDGNDGVPGGACITNTGCDGFSENARSGKLATATAVGYDYGISLVYRQYLVRKGTGTLSQNVANSNAWGARMHVPLHSNAKKESCGNTTKSGHGTQGLYYNANDKACAKLLVSYVGAGSPGTSDQIIYRSNLGELKANAVSCYSESEFHTWQKGVDWLRSSDAWAYRVAATIDNYFNYPRIT